MAPITITIIRDNSSYYCEIDEEDNILKLKNILLEKLIEKGEDFGINYKHICFSNKYKFLDNHLKIKDIHPNHMFIFSIISIPCSEHENNLLKFNEEYKNDLQYFQDNKNHNFPELKNEEGFIIEGVLVEQAEPIIPPAAPRLSRRIGQIYSFAELSEFDGMPKYPSIQSPDKTEIYNSVNPVDEFDGMPEYPPIQSPDKTEIYNSVNPVDEFIGMPKLINNNIDDNSDSDLEDLPELD